MLVNRLKFLEVFFILPCRQSLLGGSWGTATFLKFFKGP